MMTPDDTEHLICARPVLIDEDSVLCLALAHNEVHIILQFLEHYRSLGVTQFIIVDDHSTDGTAELLAEQEDVTIYNPKPGSSYKKDKIAWRCDLLDQMADQRWVLLPDIDEHLVFPSMEKRDIHSLISHLEKEDARALFTVMVDMYADKPLKDHVFDGGRLLDVFPFFDAPSDPTVGYRLMPPAKRFLKRFPTPPICAYGGLRDRMFYSENNSSSFIGDFLLRNFANMDRPLDPNFWQKITNSITRRVTKHRFAADPFSMTKIGMIKWEKGLKLPGGPHAVSKKLKLSHTTAVFLHFKFTNGVKGIVYVAERKQHAGDSAIYQKILAQVDLFDLSPFYEGSIRYTGPKSFIDCGMIRTGNQKQ